MNKNVIILAVLAIAGAAAFTGLTVKSNKVPGTPDNPIQMAFAPSRDIREVYAAARKVEEEIGKRTGYSIEVSVPPTYQDVLLTIQLGRVHIGWLSPLTYVVAREDFKVDPLLISEREGSLEYRGIILVRSDSPIKTVADLKGKTVAFADPLSTSGSLYPKQLMKKAGLNPEKDIKALYSGGHDRAIVALVNGKADAACCYADKTGDARSRALETIPGVMSKTRILASTPSIPNDNIAAVSNLPEQIREKIKKALLDMAETPEGTKMLQELASIDGFKPVDDSAYDSVREVARDLNIDLQQAVKTVRKPQP